ncbi:hypothetical protein G4Y73_09955 [Wenzhouxiangella sp. XN201]|uniref:hypothetical protein n=1 Tax=Wenzhouxiangella sp. XN201 TaxID=2710755 RepID=UPI0013C6E4E1|nr:hypothetical protein [Wenzhouxiangella sp. XN201]NEZ04470.1 hypothetical protein [Wenzhouxiangella sp. XN201]
MDSGKSSSNIHELGSGRSGDAFEVPADQLERIIARAAVFQNASGEGEQRRLSEEEVISIGEEVGLSPGHVRRALAEWRADTLAPPAPEDDPIATRLVGPAHVRVRRVIEGEAAAVHRRFERHLRETEHMRPIRMRANESFWEPIDGLATTLRKGLSWMLDEEGRNDALSEVQSLSIVTAPAGDDQTMVTLSADQSEDRSKLLQGWGWSLASLLVVAVVLGWTESTWLGALLFGAAVVGAVLAPFMMSRNFRATRRRTALLLEGLLDQLEYRR